MCSQYAIVVNPWKTACQASTKVALKFLLTIVFDIMSQYSIAINIDII